MRRIGNITAFFGAADVFSNWHPCSFTFHEVKFNCVEQFMMYAKAMLFNDHVTAEAILASTSPREQKRLGRSVRGFDEQRWIEAREKIMFVGCREKFRQNEAFAIALLATGTSSWLRQVRMTASGASGSVSTTRVSPTRRPGWD